MSEIETNLHFLGKNQFLGEIATLQELSPEAQAIRVFLRDLLRAPIRGVLLRTKVDPYTPSIIESVVFADLRINHPTSEEIVDIATDADARLDKSLTPPLTSSLYFVNTLGRDSCIVRYSLWREAHEPESQLIVGAVFT